MKILLVYFVLFQATKCSFNTYYDPQYQSFLMSQQEHYSQHPYYYHQHHLHQQHYQAMLIQQQQYYAMQQQHYGNHYFPYSKDAYPLTVAPSLSQSLSSSEKTLEITSLTEDQEDDLVCTEKDEQNDQKQLTLAEKENILRRILGLQTNVEQEIPEEDLLEEVDDQISVTDGKSDALDDTFETTMESLASASSESMSSSITSCTATQCSVTDLRTRKNELLVGTINVEGLNPSSDADLFIQIAQKLDKLNADIVGLTEVSNDPETIEKLLMKMKTKYFWYSFDSQDFVLQKAVYIISKIKFENRESSITNGSRSIPKSGIIKGKIVRKDGHEKMVAIALVHLLSRGGGLSFGNSLQKLREKKNYQADIIKERMDILRQQGYSCILMGDFNDSDYSVPESLPSTGIYKTKTLEIIKKDSPFVNSALLLPASKRSTHETGMVDHILVDSDLEIIDCAIVGGCSRFSDHNIVLSLLRLDPDAPLEFCRSLKKYLI